MKKNLIMEHEEFINKPNSSIQVIFGDKYENEIQKSFKIIPNEDRDIFKTPKVVNLTQKSIKFSSTDDKDIFKTPIPIKPKAIRSDPPFLSDINSSKCNSLPLSSSKRRLLFEYNDENNDRKSPISVFSNGMDDKSLSPMYTFKNSPSYPKRLLIDVSPVITPEKCEPIKKSSLRKEFNFEDTPILDVIKPFENVDDSPIVPPQFEYEQTHTLKYEIQTRQLPHEIDDDGVVVISPNTAADILNNKFIDSYDKVLIIDTRYPYEYEAGHILDAINIYDPSELQSLLFSESLDESLSTKTLVILYCEYSEKRSKEMIKYMHQIDRDVYNKCKYPHLSYPELYLLQGGYHKFIKSKLEYCCPQCYVPMNSEQHKNEKDKYCQELRRSWKKLGRKFHIY